MSHANTKIPLTRLAMLVTTVLVMIGCGQTSGKMSSTETCEAIDGETCSRSERDQLSSAKS